MKTIDEINERIRQGKAAVVTAEELVSVVREKGAARAARMIDVVTTGTFGPMCSSGAFLNIGHANPRMKLGGGNVTLNGVVAYAGLAAADVYIGAGALREDDPRNAVRPGRFVYGGGHVIEDLVEGKEIELRADGYGTDCYPRKELHTYVSIATLNECVLMNPRNAYQNYNVAVNLSDRTIYTYMGMLKPRMANATYCSAGQLSPLLKDPAYRTTGVGTKVFLGGGVGYVAWHGTQHNPDVPRNDQGVPRTGAGTLALVGDMKQMDRRFLRGASIAGYGATLCVGVGVPIPVLDEDVCRAAALDDASLTAPVVDYSGDYPNRVSRVLAEVSYAELKSGEITIDGKKVRTASLSSYAREREIAETLKGWVASGRFELTNPVKPLPRPGEGYTFRPLADKPVEGGDDNGTADARR